MEGKKSFWQRVLNALSSFAVWFMRISVVKTGFEKFPDDGSALIVSNHMSLFDPVVLTYLLKDRNVTYISKPENFKIPVIGSLFKKCGYLAIDRDSPRNALQTIYQAADLLRDGCSVMVYPEGTRNRNPENGLLPFHNGVFKIAKRAEAPVVVMVVTGTELVKKNGPWKRTEVKVEVVDLLDTEFVTANNDREIGERVRAGMESVFPSRMSA